MTKVIPGASREQRRRNEPRTEDAEHREPNHKPHVAQQESDDTLESGSLRLILTTDAGKSSLNPFTQRRERPRRVDVGLDGRLERSGREPLCEPCMHLSSLFSGFAASEPAAPAATAKPLKKTKQN